MPNITEITPYKLTGWIRSWREPKENYFRGRDGEKLKNNWSNRTVTWLGNCHLGWQQKGRHAGKQTRNLVGIRAKIQGNM